MRTSLHLVSTGLLAGVLAIAACSSGGNGGDGQQPVTHAISGTVTGATAVTVTLSGAASRTTTSDGTGAFSFTGLADGAYTVTPSKAGFTFTPPSRAVAVAGADVAGQSFTAAAIPTHGLSGTVTVTGGGGLSGVAVSLSGAATAGTTTGAGGTYSFTGLADGAYTVTPSLTGFTFTPANRAATVAGADVAGLDFVATAVSPGTHAISGTVTGTTTEGVTVWLGGAASASTTTTAGGAWSFTGLADGAYTVTPSLLDGAGTYHVFSPPRRAVTLAGADATGLAFAGTPLQDFESFAGLPSGERWDSGHHTALQENGVAFLASAIDAPARSTAYGSQAVLVPPAGRLTKLQAVVELFGMGTSVTGDAQARAGIDLMFQPLADRVASPDNQTNALYVRLALQQTSSGLVALRQIFECTAADCTTTQGVGSAVPGSGSWPAVGVTVDPDTRYTISIEFFPASSQFKFSLDGGTVTATTTLDLSGVVSPPFPIDLSSANFHRARLLTQVRGVLGGAGTGGSVAALFDDVAVGVNGQASTPFDDFGTGTMFDPARWTAGGDLVEVFQGNLSARLWQRDSPEVSGLTMDRDLVPAPTALQARVRVQILDRAGSGQVGARLAAVLYNDGSAGLGTEPDVNKASSQVGDVIAQISLTDTDVSYAVVRCNVAVCTGPKAIDTGHTFVVPRTSLRTTAVNTNHQLLLRWDPATHLVVFQVDGRAPAVVDPTAGPTGLPVAGPPNRPFWQIANHATAAAPGVDFGPGSEGTIYSLFSFVKKL